jgi:hypothetical protein
VGAKVWFYSFFNLRIIRHAPAALLPGKEPGARRTGDWVGTRAGLEGWEISLPPAEFDPRTVQRVESRYTCYVILAIFPPEGGNKSIFPSTVLHFLTDNGQMPGHRPG